MTEPTPIFIPYIHGYKNDELTFSKPHKIIFYDSYLELFSVREYWEPNPDTNIKEMIKVDYQGVILKNRIISTYIAKISRSDIFEDIYEVKIYTSNEADFGIKFDNKPEAKKFYEQIKTWLIK